MAHHQHRMLKLAQISLKPLNRVEVEIIRRLIEQQVVRIAKKSLCQHHTHLLLARELAHELIMLILLYTQTAQQSRSIALRRVSAHLGKLVLKLSHTNTVLVRKVRLRIQSLTLLHNLPHRCMPHENRVEHRLLIILEVILTKHTQTLASPKLHTTLSRLQLTTNSLQQRRLARPVGTNNTIDVTIRELHVHILVQHSLAELYTNIRKCNHKLRLSE